MKVLSPYSVSFPEKASYIKYCNAVLTMNSLKIRTIGLPRKPRQTDFSAVGGRSVYDITGYGMSETDMTDMMWVLWYPGDVDDGTALGVWTTEINAIVADPIPPRYEDRSVIPSPGQSLNFGSGDQPWDSGFFVNVSTLSDRRRKKNIALLEEGREIVDKLQPVTFVFKDGGVRTHIGFEAQAVQPVIEQYITNCGLWCETAVKDPVGAGVTDADTIQSLRMEQFIPILVKTCQQLGSQLDETRAALTTALDRINVLEQKMASSGGGASQ